MSVRRAVATAAVLVAVLLAVLVLSPTGGEDPPARVTESDLGRDRAFWDRLSRGQQLELVGLCKARYDRTGLRVTGPAPSTIEAGDLRTFIGAALKNGAEFESGAVETVGQACAVAVDQVVAIRGALPRRDGRRQTNATWGALLRYRIFDTPIPRAGTVGDPVELLARVERSFSDAMAVTVLSPGKTSEQGDLALVPGHFDEPRHGFVSIVGHVGGEDGCRPVETPAHEEAFFPDHFPRCAVVIDASSVLPVTRARARAALSRPLRQARLDVRFTAHGWGFRVTKVRLFPRVTALYYTVANFGPRERSIVLEGARLPPYRGVESFVDAYVPAPESRDGFIITPDQKYSGDLAPGAEKAQSATLNGAVGVRKGRIVLRLEWTSTQGARDEKFTTVVTFPLRR